MVVLCLYGAESAKLRLGQCLYGWCFHDQDYSKGEQKEKPSIHPFN